MLLVDGRLPPIDFLLHTNSKAVMESKKKTKQQQQRTMKRIKKGKAKAEQYNQNES